MTPQSPVQIERNEQHLPQIVEEIEVGDSRLWQMWDNSYHAPEVPSYLHVMVSSLLSLYAER